jgi:hydrogenase expression/formation protein HypD
LGFDLSAFRDPELARRLSGEIEQLAADHGAAFMEVCGTHTVSIARSGLKRLLPANVRLVSGPGCPVCVTPQGEIERAIAAARVPGVMLATFGDMLRIPGEGGSLESIRSRGADVRVIFSPRDALALAREHSATQIVLLGVGFETTIPAFCATVLEARGLGIENLSILNSFRLVPPALRAVLQAGPGVDGFILPGHVSAILGTAPYEFLAEAGRGAVIAGFEPLDVLLAVKMLLEQISSDNRHVGLAYRRAVRPAGNPQARGIIADVFEPVDAAWRGLGSLVDSGLAFRSEFSEFDAARRLKLETPDVPEPRGCCCAEVLLGRVRPEECELFGKVCTPESPIGPCMVSSEGSCAAEYRYGRVAD